MFKVILAIALSFQSQAFAREAEKAFPKSQVLSSLLFGFENAGIEATDVYSNVYDVSRLSRVKDFKTYLERLTGVSDLLMQDASQSSSTLAFSLAKDLMTADGYQANPRLQGIGYLVVPLEAALNNSSIKVFTGFTSDEESHASHQHLVLVDIRSKEVLVLTVGYSE